MDQRTIATAIEPVQPIAEQPVRAFKDDLTDYYAKNANKFAYSGVTPDVLLRHSYDKSSERDSLDFDSWTQKHGLTDFAKTAPAAATKFMEDQAFAAAQPESRGIVGGTMAALGRGAMNVVGAAGHTLELANATPNIVDTDKGLLDRAGQSLVDWSEEKKAKTQFMRPTKQEDAGEVGLIKRGWEGAVESLPLTGGVAASALTGAAIGSAVASGPGTVIGGIAGGLVGMAGLFGAGTYGQTYESAYKELKQKRPEASEEEVRSIAHKGALTDAAWETGSELVSDLAALATFGGSKMVTQPLTKTLKEIVKPGFKKYLMDTAKHMPFEVGSEVATAYGQADWRAREGLDGGDRMAAMGEAILPAIFMSAAIGTGVAGYKEATARKLLGDVNSEDVGTRTKAVNEIAQRMYENTEDKEVTKKFLDMAGQHVDSGLPITIDEKISEWAAFKTLEDAQSAGKEIPIEGAVDNENQPQAPSPAETLLTGGQQTTPEAVLLSDEPIIAPEQTVPEQAAPEQAIPEQPAAVQQSPTQPEDLDALWQQRIADREAENQQAALDLEWEERLASRETEIKAQELRRKIANLEGVPGKRNERQEANLAKSKEELAKLEQQNPQQVAPQQQPVTQQHVLSQQAMSEPATPAISAPQENLDAQWQQRMDEREAATQQTRLGIEWDARTRTKAKELERKIANLEGVPGKRNERQEANLTKAKEELATLTDENNPKFTPINPLSTPPVQEQGPSALDVQAHEAATSPFNDLPEPTQVQKEAGNYKKAHVRVNGLDVSIENPAGSERKGTDKDGKEWSTVMRNHYGYIKGSLGADKDHVYVFLSDKPDQGNVFVVDQIDPKTGKFDEHKAMIGFGSEEEARAAYLSNYEQGWKGVGAITEMTPTDFKKWVFTKKTKNPVGDIGQTAPAQKQVTSKEHAQETAKPVHEREAQGKGQAETTAPKGAFPFVASIAANVIRKTKDMSAMQAAKAWVSRHISRTARTQIGEVEVDERGIQNSMSHSMYQNKLDAVQAIMPVLENGEYLGALQDKDGKPIENFYFAGNVRIGDEDKVVFVRTRRVSGRPNRFYVHEVFTEDEIQKPAASWKGYTDADRRSPSASDFYRKILADALEVKLKSTPAAQKTEAKPEVKPETKPEVKPEPKPESAKQTASNDVAKQETEVAATDDAGEELGANRRNILGRGLTWDDLKDKNPSLRIKEAVKSKIIPKPDYQAMIDDGLDPIIVHLFKQAYDGIAAKPTSRKGDVEDSDIQKYITAANRIMGELNAWARSEGAALFVKGMSRGGTMQEGAASPFAAIYGKGVTSHQEEVTALGGMKFLNGLRKTSSDIKRAAKDIERGWPGTVESWKKQGYAVRRVGSLMVTFYAGTDSKENPYVYIHISESGRYNNVASVRIDGATSGRDQKVQDAVAALKEKYENKYVLFSKTQRAVSVHETEEEAVEAARKAATKDRSGIKDEGISVEAAKRKGNEHREPGENISSERLRETFGFRGINFGNWMKGKGNEAERQLHLNHAYDSFMDLADMLGVPHRALSLNGILGLAIGAQGRRGYAAHFVPGLNEINLTRTSGAGALAHEWAHALDHYFGTQAGLERSDRPFLTEHVGVGRSAPEGLRQEIFDLFRTIVQQMQRRPLSKAEIAARREADIAKFTKYLKGWLKSVDDRHGFSALDDATVISVDGKDVSVKSLFERTVRNILNGDVGEGKVKAGLKTYLSPEVSTLRTLCASMRNSKISMDTFKSIQSNVDALVFAQYNQKNPPETQPSTQTSYLESSIKADKAKGGKAYWSTNVEMFARAFDAYVHDTLKERAMSNTYLGHESRTEPYSPVGAERERINAAFAELVAELKTKETDKGVAMYALAGKNTTTDRYALRPDALGLYSALEHAVDEMPFKAMPARDLALRIPKLTGIKAEEIADLGIVDWLQGLGAAKVGKEEVLRFIQAGDKRPQSFSPTLDDLRRLFPKAKIAQKDGRFVITQGKASFSIEGVDEITPDELAFRLAYDRKPTSNDAIAGEYKNGEIRVSRHGDKWTIMHEYEHFLEDMGFITTFEQAVLNSAIMKRHKEGTLPFTLIRDKQGRPVQAENRAYFIQHLLDARDFDRKTTIGRILQKIADFVDAIVNLHHRTARGVARDVESGRTTKRGSNQGIAFDRAQTAGLQLPQYALADTIQKASEFRHDLMHRPEVLGRFNLLNTQLHKALKNPAFGRIFNRFHDAAGTQSRAAARAAANAKDILPDYTDGFVKSAKDLVRRGQYKPEDFRAVSTIMSACTLAGKSPSPYDGHRLTEAELKALESGQAVTIGGKDITASKGQVALLRQARAALDTMIQDMAASEAWRAIRGTLGKEAREYWQSVADSAGIAQETMTKMLEAEQLKAQVSKTQAEQEALVMADVDDMDGFAEWGQKLKKLVVAERNLDRFTEKQKASGDLDANTAKREERIAKLAAELDLTDDATAVLKDWQRINKAYMAAAQQTENAKKSLQEIADIFEQADKLIAAGYTPLSRFGRYRINVTNAEGKQIYVAMFDTSTEANRERRKLVAAFAAEDPTAIVGNVTKESEESWKLYQGGNPEAMMLFAKQAGAKEPLLHKYYAEAVSNRSALKRLIRRHGYAGYSDDLQRILASFVTSGSKRIGQNYHAADLAEMIDDSTLPGELQDEAIKLREFIQNPGDAGSSFRAFAANWYMLGSLMSAAWNGTQVVTSSLPELYKHTGSVGKAAQSIWNAYRTIIRKGEGLTTSQKEALQRAEQDGTVESAEIHHLYAMATKRFVNRLGSGEAARKLGIFLRMWGMPFAWFETLNRKATFLAAYRMAEDMKTDDPYAMAKQLVDITQGVYAKHNRPNVARSAMGGAVLTFMQYKIQTLEQISRNMKEGGQARKAAMLQLAIIAAMGGWKALPGVEDIMDLLDAIMQVMGNKAWLTRKKIREAVETGGREAAGLLLEKEAAAAVGRFVADFANMGVSAALPVDVSGRAAMGNLVPGIKLLKPSTQYRDSEVFALAGVPGSLIESVVDASSMMLHGEFGRGLTRLSPNAVQAVIKGADIAATGEIRNTRGQKIIEGDMVDAALQTIGGQPKIKSEINTRLRDNKELKFLAQQEESSIVQEWADAYGKKTSEERSAAMAAARKRITDWNQKNPEWRIVVKQSQVMNELKNRRKTVVERAIKSAPKELRQAMAV